jgi:hypothetical protein
MPSIDFNVESKHPVILEGGIDLSKFNLMSPFVWEEPDGCFAMMVRAVTKNRAATDETGMIYYGVSTDGLTFTMDETPAIAPGPGALDIGGCEDPTVVSTSSITRGSMRPARVARCCMPPAPTSAA